MIKERYLYKIFPVKLKADYSNFHIGMLEEEIVKIIGFYGFIFKILKIKWYEKVYRYHGNYFKGLYNQYKFNKTKNEKIITNEETITIDILKV